MRPAPLEQRPVAHRATFELAPVLGVAAVVAAVVSVVWLGDHVPYDAWGPFVVIGVLIGVSAVLIRRTAALADDPALMTRILVLALLVKLVSALVRHYVAFDVYEGATDAAGYHRAGLAIQHNLRDGWLSLEGSGLEGYPSETGRIGVVTGVIYTLLGGHQQVGYMAFAWFGFIGQMLFWRAFRVGFPAGDSRRYAWLVLFVPSLLFWPAAIGKEAYMAFALGWASLGVAHLFGPRPRLGRGCFHLVAGLLIALQVRPHIAFLVLVGIGVALLARRPGRISAASVTTRVVAVVLLVPALVITTTRLDDFFGVERFNAGSLSTILEDTRERTSQGGSEFEAHPVRSPADLPQAFGSVLLRPYPWQVDSGPLLLASLETLGLIALALASWRRLATLPRRLVTTPYLAYAVGFTVVFIIAFSNVANVGILARQRTQILPLALTVLALPAVSRPQDPGKASLQPAGSYRVPKPV